MTLEQSVEHTRKFLEHDGICGCNVNSTRTKTIQDHVRCGFLRGGRAHLRYMTILCVGKALTSTFENVVCVRKRDTSDVK